MKRFRRWGMRIIIAAVLAAGSLFALSRFDYVLSSWLFSLNPAPSSDVLVVALDEVTLWAGDFKRYQDIDRCDYASLIETILHDDPRMVAVDIFFHQAGEDIGCDRALAEAADDPRVILGTEYDPSQNPPIATILGSSTPHGENI